MVLNVVKIREGWELYTVTDGVMVGILLGEAAQMGSFTQLYPNHYAICHNIQLPSFSAFHDIGHHLSIFISDSLMMVF
jgi:hypothetical protein